MKKRLGISLLLVLALAFSACGKEDTANRVLATVNGEEITQEMVAQKGNLVKGWQQVEVTDENQAQFDAFILENVIGEVLIEQDAQRRGIVYTMEDAEAEVMMTLEAYVGTVEEYEKNYLEPMGLTLEDFIREQQRVGSYYGVTNQVIANAQIDPQAIYAENPEAYYQKEQVSASHILVETEEEANDIIAKLNDGADFNELALQYSIDTTAAYNEGQLGYFVREDMVKEFSDAAFAMEVGTFSSVPVKTTFGWHVIWVDDKIAAHPMTYEEAEAKIIETAQQEVINDWLNELWKNAEIVYAEE